MAVDGYRSPASIAALTTFAETPFTFSFLNSFATGELSSNHCASALNFSARFVASRSLIFTMLSHELFNPRGSPYDSMNPFTKSTTGAVFSTHAMLYSSNVFKEPVS